jgi:hypothetical protein
MRALLDGASRDQFSTLYALALTSGMRQSAPQALQWTDVDLEVGPVHVRWQVQREEGQ